MICFLYRGYNSQASEAEVSFRLWLRIFNPVAATVAISAHMPTVLQPHPSPSDVSAVLVVS